MNENKELGAWTPGPWCVEDRRNDAANRGGGALQVQAQHRGEGSSYCIASVNFWEAPEANANLIAAAPDLYEAGKALVDARLAVEASSVNVSEARFKELCATVVEAEERLITALARARGEQP